MVKNKQANSVTDLQKANLAFKAGDYDTAIALYKKVSAQVPPLANSVQFNIAYMQKRLNRAAAAQNLVQTAAITAPAENKGGGPFFVKQKIIDKQSNKKQRVAVFAAYSADGYLAPQVLPYLKGLAEVAETVVVVFDNELLMEEKEKLNSFSQFVITGRHGEYDFGSYKRGVGWLDENGYLDTANDLILCNDSCYGPIGSFSSMFTKMESRNLDFWGVSESYEFTYHLQSFFVVLGRAVFISKAFKKFISGVKKQPNVHQVIMNYELGMTKTLCEAGFRCEALVKPAFDEAHPKDPTYKNVTLHPFYMISEGSPLIKVKALTQACCAIDGQNRLLAWLKENASDIYLAATSLPEIKQFEDADDIGFSIIMPTKNRERTICKAIESVLNQTHKNYELIIIDDGSTDKTKEIIDESFCDLLKSGMLKYIKLPSSLGVSNARNVGLAHAKNEWIAYIDSDNTVRPYFLTVYAHSIIEFPDADAFYGRAMNVGSGTLIGKPFNKNELLLENYIDLGVFVHRLSLVSRFGWFDPGLSRLVDWDLIIRYTRHKSPHFIKNGCYLDYNDKGNIDRISIKESYSKAHTIVCRKHSPKPTVTTVVISYNHKDYIEEAIESALSQKGDFIHEILLSDDGSKDGTSDIINTYAKKYPKLIRDISSANNIGISENYRKSFKEAGGEFVAVLEGDDYWIDPEKNYKQAIFLKEYADAAMVFSRIELLDMNNNKTRLLNRQNGLSKFITGREFSENEHLNLIANFSSCMFRRDVLQKIPSFVFEPRLNEICLAFYIDRIGKIGFLDKVMGMYRLNSTSVWTGATEASRLEQAIAIRENALRIARSEFREQIYKRLYEKRQTLKNTVSIHTPCRAIAL